MIKWETIIGLEVHVQLKTRSKIFTGASTAYGAPPNTQACDVSIALPGVLPVMNRAAVELAVRFGLAIGAKINQRSIFARKNYFYPDLPKGYQISQNDAPIIGRGVLDITIDDNTRQIGITRAHLEEDAGKSLHEDFHGYSGIDLNRAGTPLLEIVSEPDMRSAREAVAYLKKLHRLVRYLDICDGNLQEGSFRCDANVSVRPQGQRELGTRTELKNINSFRFVEKAIDYEVTRQIDILINGGTIMQETRLYDADRNETRPMRTKEDAHDYRYFPDPDLPEMVLDDGFIEAIGRSMPELPDQRQHRFTVDMGLNPNDAQKLVSERAVAHYFEAVCAQSVAPPQRVANWINGELSSALNRHQLGIEQSPVDSLRLATLLDRVEDQTISGKIAKELFLLLWDSDRTVDDIIREKGLKQMTDAGEIEAIIDTVLKNSEKQVNQYKQGNQKILGFFVGQIMKQTRGKANPRQVNEILRNKLD